MVRLTPDKVRRAFGTYSNLTAFRIKTLLRLSYKVSILTGSWIKVAGGEAVSTPDLPSRRMLAPAQVSCLLPAKYRTIQTFLQLLKLLMKFSSY